MKNTFIVVMALFQTILGFGQEAKFAKFEADITNATGIVYISFNEKVIKQLVKNTDGVYKDTLNATPGNYNLFDGKNYIPFFLNNQSDLKLKMDSNDVDNTIAFTGSGSDVNNFMAQSKIASKKIDFMGMFSMEEKEFNAQAIALKQMDLDRLEKYIQNPEIKTNIRKSIDTQYESLPGIYKSYKVQIEQAKKAKELQNLVGDKMNNVDSPSFDYLNIKGGKTKLEDFRGKYVYIDIWATWCGPCRAEIPHLKKMEEDFHAKNIVFVSISIDAANDFEKWKSFVAEKNLGGVQLFADNDWNSEFIKSYNVTGIPRFILIDPKGKVVKGSASRPSDPELRKELDKLLN